MSASEIVTRALVAAEDGAREARLDGCCAWLRRVRVLSATGADVGGRTADGEETALIVLSGTHDLQAGGGAWPSRGLRGEPFAGRPVALYLPPRTTYSASAGRGELLLVAARRPDPPRAPDPERAAAAKPLLPLAGSNKAFDAASGTWQPIESFPDAPQAVLPRAIPRIEAAGVVVERVFPFDYKCLGLCVDEAVLQEGQSLEVPGHGVAGYPRETAVYYRTEGRLAADAGGAPAQLAGEGVARGARSLRAVSGRAYLAFVHAGPKR